MKLQDVIKLLILVGAVIDASMGLLADIGLSEKTISIIRLVGLIVAVVVDYLNGQTFQKIKTFIRP